MYATPPAACAPTFPGSRVATPAGSSLPTSTQGSHSSLGSPTRLIGHMAPTLPCDELLTQWPCKAGSAALRAIPHDASVLGPMFRHAFPDCGLLPLVFDLPAGAVDTVESCLDGAASASGEWPIPLHATMHRWVGLRGRCANYGELVDYVNARMLARTDAKANEGAAKFFADAFGHQPERQLVAPIIDLHVADSSVEAQRAQLEGLVDRATGGTGAGCPAAANAANVACGFAFLWRDAAGAWRLVQFWGVLNAPPTVRV